jgi:hypothetical protein
MHVCLVSSSLFPGFADADEGYCHQSPSYHCHDLSIAPAAFGQKLHQQLNLQQKQSGDELLIAGCLMYVKRTDVKRP